MKQDIYPDLSNEEYHGDHGSYSKSSLADFSVYPLNLIFQRQHRERKKIFDIGTAAHTAILEPEKFESEIAVVPPSVLSKNGSTNTNAYREWAVSVPPEKAIVKEPERDKVLRMRDSVHENPAHSEAKELVTGGMPEVSCFWDEHFRGEEIDKEAGYKYMVSDQWSEVTDETHVLKMKCRPDYIVDPKKYKKLIAVDLKTYNQQLGDIDKLERHCIDHKYHWSAGLTLRGLTRATGKRHRIYKFVFVETSAPHEVMVLNASEDFLAFGRKESMAAMRRLAWCDKHNKWPGIPNRVHQLGLPGYVLKKLNS